MKAGAIAARVGVAVPVRVTVVPSETVAITRLWVYLWWMAEGGDDDLDHLHVAHEIELLTDTSIDGPRTYEVALTAPEGPPTFAGDTVQIRWVVTANVRVEDERKGAHAVVPMGPAAAPTGDPAAVVRTVARHDESEHDDRGVRLYMRLAAVLGLTLFVLIGAGGLVVSMFAARRFIGVPVLAGFLLLLAFGAAEPVRSDLAELRARVRRRDTPVVGTIGGTVTVTGLRGPGVRLFRIEEAARMETVSRRGSSHRRKVWRTRELGLSRATATGGRAAVELPAGSAPTLETDTRRIRWELRTEAEIVPVIVLPWE